MSKLLQHQRTLDFCLFLSNVIINLVQFLLQQWLLCTQLVWQL